MKNQRRTHYLVMAMIVGVFAFATLSCDKDDDPSLADLREDKLQYLEDSLRISDSLKRINAAGIVNYAITVVNGSTASFANADGDVDSRSKATQNAVDGAIVTISQFGKTMKDTTDASGMVVFNGFFRSAVNVTVQAEGFTEVSYISAVSTSDSTENNTISFVGNMIPIFETTGANTATITGRATVQTDLTNKNRELVPDGTTIVAHIDATDEDFREHFLRQDEYLNGYYNDNCECEIIFVGLILQASYSTGVVGTVANGQYSLTVPAAIDELPIELEYSDFAADQTLYEEDGNGQLPGDRTSTYRTIFGSSISPSPVTSGTGLSISFDSGSGAAANAIVSATTGEIDRIVVIDGGSGYAGTPAVRITDESGTGATATAVVTNGVVTAINVTNGGSGYVNPTVELLTGFGASATTNNLGQDGTILSIVVTNSGSGYTTPPTVAIDAPTGTGLGTNVQATATAVVTNGRVTAINITNPGAGYVTDPLVTITGATTGTPATATAFHSGQSVQDVLVISPGAQYSFAPRVVFDAPDLSTGRRARGTATINPTTGQVTGITITDVGMGYLAAPGVTLISNDNDADFGVIMEGGSVIGAELVSPGIGYTGVPFVTISGGGGQGATATAIVSNGLVVGIEITNGGSGYFGIPEITIHTGDGAEAYAVVTNGQVTGVTITDPGKFYVGNPVVTIGSSSDEGGGATATATTNAAGGIASVTITEGGSGYIEGNTPGDEESFSSTRSSSISVKPGKTYINDIHYGTGARQPN